MYWCVGTEDSEDDSKRDMAAQDDPMGMGARQSSAGGLSIGQGPATETVEGAYRSGEFGRAQELIKAACQENISAVEKGLLLSLSTAYGDLETVRYLLKEACVTLPLEPNDDNPAVVAAYFGHTDVAKELLDSFHGPANMLQLLNWMLAIACQQGHLDIAKLLVLTYKAAPDSYALRKNEFAALTRLPLYAAMKAGHEKVAAFLLENGSFFSSYVLVDCPSISKQVLRKYFVETIKLPGNAPAKTALSVNWSNLGLPWVDLEWLIDISYQITELDLSANCLTSLPSVIPWGLINLQKLNLAENRLNQLPDVHSSDGIICTKLLEIDISSNRFLILPSGFLHLSRLQRLVASKNYLEKLLDAENGGCFLAENFWLACAICLASGWEPVNLAAILTKPCGFVMKLSSQNYLCRVTAELPIPCQESSATYPTVLCVLLLLIKTYDQLAESGQAADLMPV